jgi:hypothetical protein
VSEFDSNISLSDVGGYDGVLAGGIARRSFDAGIDPGSLISDRADFEHGAAWLGD